MSGRVDIDVFAAVPRHVDWQKRGRSRARCVYFAFRFRVNDLPQKLDLKVADI